MSTGKRLAVDQATLERYREVKINFEANMIPNYPVAEWELLEEKAVSYSVSNGYRSRRELDLIVFDETYVCVCVVVMSNLGIMFDLA
jgi:hypothetical protein